MKENLLFETIVDGVSCLFDVFHIEHVVLNEFISCLIQFSHGTLDKQSK